MSVVAGYHEAYRAVIRASQNGATPEDIVDAIEQGMGDRSAKSRRSVFSRVRRLGFLEPKDGLVFFVPSGSCGQMWTAGWPSDGPRCRH